MKKKRWIFDEISTERFSFVAWIGIVGHPSYWYFWHYFYPEYFDSAFLRFAPAVVFLLLLLKEYWPSCLKPLSNTLWHLTLMFSLPVIFTFTLLANNYNGFWLATHVGMLLLLQTAVQYVRTFFLLLVPGTLIGILWYQVTINGDALIHFPVEYIPVFLFVTVVGLAFLHLSTQNIVEKERHIERERQKSANLKSLAGTIAHEMRNPLAQIHGSLQLVQIQTPDLNSNGYIKDAYRVIENGLQVIDITMDAIKEKPIDRDSFILLSARDVVVESVADFAYVEAEHANRISVTGGDFKIMANPVLVKYVLYNLIKNALWYVKALPDAAIVISVTGNQIEVRDTGPGIAADIIRKLFDGFYSADKQGGTGLGLSYCKRTMMALGGDIHCHSELGLYSAFVLSFPVPSQQQIERANLSEQSL